MHLRYHLKQVLNELVKRSGIPGLEFATLEELSNFFAGIQINLSEIKKRRKGYVSILRNGRTVILTSEKTEPYRKRVIENLRGSTEIRGSVANKGKARGRVRIISFSAPDYDEQVRAFKKGEILVTGMTRPQIVHLCRKATAIVTDEGGITSHAAVVSRELDVPCIIATRNATKIFKTGDMVAVDANEGVIKKLSR